VSGRDIGSNNPNPAIQIGPWTDTKVQDLPYSLTTMDSSLIDNLQAWQPENLFKVIPEITNVVPQQNSSGNPFQYIRGFAVTQFTNGGGISYDGLIGGAGGTDFMVVLDDKDRVELLSGADGFLYGIDSVGGDVNYVLKRPTATPHFSVIAGDNAGANGYVHVDTGGPLGKSGIFGYRINGVEQNGATNIAYQRVKRDLLSAAVDVHARPNLLVQFNFQNLNYLVNGMSPAFSLNTYTATNTAGTLHAIPHSPDPTAVKATPWTQFYIHNTTEGAKFTWRINKHFTWRTFFDYAYEVRPEQEGNGRTLENMSGTEWETINGGGAVQYNMIHSLYSFVDADFTTFGVQHKITAGFNGTILRNEAIANNWQWNATYTSAKPYITNMYNETIPANPGTYMTTGGKASAGNSTTEVWTVGDMLSYGRHWGAVIGLSEPIYRYIAFEGTSTNPISLSMEWPNTMYNTAKFTPSYSIMYKPIDTVSTYVSYQQSLMQGQFVSTTAAIPYTNAGQMLPPTMAHQWEAGVKATLRPNVLLTAALYNINKANTETIENYASGVIVSQTIYESGREDHKGIELTVNGKVRHDLTLFGGATFTDPRITKNDVYPYENGKAPAAVSTAIEKLYAEYDIPRARGLVLVGGIDHIGSWHQNIPTLPATPIYAYPAYTTEDLGLRHTVNIWDKPLTFRFNVNNVTNKAYWQANSYAGLPRTILATAQYQF
jgi:iron complex outermembrane receptor protein